jgi:hypothetical protein
MKRKYNKKSEYWSNISKNGIAPQPQATTQPVAGFPTALAAWDDQPHYSVIASCGGDGSSMRNSFSAQISPSDRYKNINAGILPWENRNGLVGMQSVIVTCQKAYANVSVVRNATEASVEFSCSPLHIKTPNKTVKDFFTEWFNRVNIYSFEQQFMREYYRSGNVPIYKFNGKMSTEQYGKMTTVFGAKENSVPIKYIILNPAQLWLNGGIGYDQNWVKVLSKFEVDRLRKGLTPEDKQVFNSLPVETKQQIMAGGYNEILIPLNPKNLNFVFYKKQDYEPMAVPMIFPVLNDIEWKLELKKMDMSLSRTIEQVILMITTGEKKDQYGGGINPQNLANLQQMFQNQTLGRVLVADYTTKGEWLIPDIGSILGPEKYKQVESDIREGLQSILTGDGEKFANAQIKTKVFIERMKEAQKVFLNEFLIPEVQKICVAMNFKNVPDIEFEEIRLDDPNVAARTYLRLAELGILSPEELFTAINSGILPDAESNLIRQELYKKQRDDGLYLPLLGGTQKEDASGGNGRPNGTGTKKSSNKISPIGTKGSEDRFSATKVASLSIMASQLKDKVIAAFKKEFNKGKKLNDAQLSVAETLTKQIMVNEEYDSWGSVDIQSYMSSPKPVNEAVARAIDEIAAKYELTEFDAIIVSKSVV